MAPLNPVGVAVVGLGYWGPNLARNLLESEGATLLAVCDNHPERLSVGRTRFPSVAATSAFQDLLDDPAIEAIAIATPVSSHHSLGLAAIRAGKHVFIEKPLAASRYEAIELAEAARESNLVLMPGHTFLYSPPVLAIKALLDEGALGDIHYISMSRVNLGIHQSDVSVVWDLGAHDFSILRYWLDENPIAVAAMGRDCILPGVCDVAFVTLEYASGLLAQVDLSWLAPSKLRRTVVVGSQKMAVYDDTSSEPIRIFDSGVDVPDPQSFGEYRLTYRTGDIVSPRIPAVEPLAAELSEFCSSIRTGSTSRSTPGLGIDVVDTIERVERQRTKHACLAARVSIGE